MAVVRVTPEALAQILFPGASVDIIGATFVRAQQLLLLTIDGPDVPEGAGEVMAVCTASLGEPEPKRIVTVQFEPRLMANA